LNNTPPSVTAEARRRGRFAEFNLVQVELMIEAATG
jgi:hypothetical protein